MIKVNFTIVLLTIIIFSNCAQVKLQTMELETKSSKIPKKDRMDLAFEQEIEMTLDPATNTVPRHRLIEAREISSKIISAQLNKRAAIPNINWTELGSNNCGGRTRSILIDEKDTSGKTVWAGSVSGGLWKTTTMDSINPNWIPVSDDFSNMSVSGIAQDPNNLNTLYFCTGESYNNIDALSGDGVWKSTNGGSTWTQLNATTTAIFDNCFKILVDKLGNIFVATKVGGLMKSTDGGTTFNKVLGATMGIIGALSNTCFDIEIAGTSLIASLSGSIHKSTNNGTNWSAAQNIVVTGQRIELATTPIDSNYIYAILTTGATADTIIKSINGGLNWSTISEPDDLDPTVPNYLFTNKQGWYNVSIAVDPLNKQALFVGGLNLFKTINGGSTWTQVTHWYGGFGKQKVHADQHFVIYKNNSSNMAYFGNDGGVYRTTNATNANPTLISKEVNYRTAQFYAAEIDPVIGGINHLAGSQDNGSHRFINPTLGNTVEVTGGDGGFCHIDNNQSSFQFTSYVFNNYFRSTNGGASFSQVFFGNTGRFINPTDYDNLANIMYAAHTPGQLLRWNNPQSGSSFSTVTMAAISGQTISAITVSPNTNQRVFVGTAGGRLLRLDNANTTPFITTIYSGLPSSNISCIEVQENLDNHMLVTFSNYGVTSVWETKNGGTSWINVEGNLPDMPVRWAIFDPRDSSRVLLATELGIWKTDKLDGAATKWGTSNNGLANTRINMLKIRKSDKKIIAATHGRGLYASESLMKIESNFVSSSTLDYAHKKITFTNLSVKAVSWLWNFGDGSYSTEKNPVKTYTTSGQYTVKLTINGGIDSMVKTNYIHILPHRQTPYTNTNGGNFDSISLDFGSTALVNSINLFERGVPANALTGVNSAPYVWKTDLDANVLNANIDCALYTPSFNLDSIAVYNLTFKKSMNAAYCNAPYSFQIQYSLDTGKNWSRLGITNDPLGTNWYNRGGSSGCVVGSNIFTDGFGFVGNFNNETTNYDISGLSGNKIVSFRFLFRVRSGYNSNGYLDGIMFDDFQLIKVPKTPLPLNFLKINSQCLKEKIVLNWSIASNTLPQKFEIIKYYKDKELASFSIPSKVGNNTYSFVDLNPGDYYKIIAKDYLNSNLGEQLIVAECAELENNIHISPNPSNGVIQIRIANGSLGNIRLFNLQGQLIAKYTSTESVFNQKLDAPIGSYVLQIENGTKTFSQILQIR